MTAKFWVGGTGTWDNSTTTHWSLSTGGAGGAAVPGSSDTVTFDASSGGGTVTVDTTINGLTFQTITMGAFTGTLDFSVNNPSITLGAVGVGGLSVTGTGVRTLKLGSGTFTIKTHSNNGLDFTTTTNLTYDTTSTATFNFVSFGGGTVNSQDIVGAFVFTNNTLNITTRTDGTAVKINSAVTFKAVTFSGSNSAILAPGATLTITNATAWNGSSTGLLQIGSLNAFNNATAVTIAVASGSTASWASFNDITFSGNTMTATNSFSGGNNTLLSVTGPSAGGVVGVIGS